MEQAPSHTKSYDQIWLAFKCHEWMCTHLLRHAGCPLQGLSGLVWHFDSGWYEMLPPEQGWASPLSYLVCALRHEMPPDRRLCAFWRCDHLHAEFEVPMQSIEWAIE